MPDDRIVIPGSGAKLSGALRRVQAADPDQAIEATIVIRRPAARLLAAHIGQSRAEIEQQLAADPADMAAVRNFAGHAGLSIVEESPVKRIVRVAGTIRQMNAAFGIEIGQYQDADGKSMVSYEGPLTAPASAASVITAVLGLDQQPAARPR